MARDMIEYHSGQPSSLQLLPLPLFLFFPSPSLRLSTRLPAFLWYIAPVWQERQKKQESRIAKVKLGIYTDGREEQSGVAAFIATWRRILQPIQREWEWKERSWCKRKLISKAGGGEPKICWWKEVIVAAKGAITFFLKDFQSSQATVVGRTLLCVST